MANSAQYPSIQKTCESLAKASAGLVAWAWDDGLGVALAVFPADRAPGMKDLLEHNLPHFWGASTVAKAPREVSGLLGALGGLRPGQRLFVSAAESEVLLFAAWWPWGDGKKVSARVGVYCPGMAEPEEQALGKALRGWFGI